MWLRGHSMSLKLVPFESLGALSYSPFIVTMTISCIVCEIYRLIGRKLRHFYTPPVFSATTKGDPVGSSWRCSMLVKLEWLGYRMVKKLWRYVEPFSSDTGTSRTNRQTDRQTDGRTDRQTELLYQYRASVCWRAIKICNLLNHKIIFSRQLTYILHVIVMCV